MADKKEIPVRKLVIMEQKQEVKAADAIDELADAMNGVGLADADEEEEEPAMINLEGIVPLEDTYNRYGIDFLKLTTDYLAKLFL